MDVFLFDVAPTNFYFIGDLIVNACLPYQSFFFGILLRMLRQLPHSPSSISRLFFAWLTLAALVFGSQPVFSSCNSPKISGFWPSSGGQNTIISVYGSGFGLPKNKDTKVTINNIPVNTVEVATDSRLFFLSPSGDTHGKIVVTTSSGSATSAANFGDTTTALTVNGFWPKFWPDPATPVVYVFGSGFVSNNTQVKVNGMPANGVSVWDSNLLFFLPPISPTTGLVEVTVSKITATAPYNFTVAPTTPLPISLLHTTFDYANSMVTVAGEDGAVEPTMMLELTSATKDTPPITIETKTVHANRTGCIDPVSLSASPGNKLTMLVKHPSTGKYSTVRRVDNTVPPTTKVVAATTEVTVLEDPTLAKLPATALTSVEVAGSSVSWYPTTECPYDANTKTRTCPVVLFLHGGYLGGGDPEKGSYLGYGDPDPLVQPYLMQLLAAQGFYTISISDVDAVKGAQSVFDTIKNLQDRNNDPNDLNNRLRSDNNGLQVSLVGHSRGGSIVIDAWKKFKDYSDNPDNPRIASVKAVVGIAPMVSANTLSGVPYLTLQGTQDGFCIFNCFINYDNASNAIKSAIYIYGANHNNFNTKWVASDLSTLTTFGFSSMSGETQRLVAKGAISAFLQWHMLGESGFENFVSGRYHVSSLPNENLFWTLENPIGGLTLPVTLPVVPNAIQPCVSLYGCGSLLPDLTNFVTIGNTIPGTLLEWNQNAQYIARVENGATLDLSGHSFLNLRVAKLVNKVPPSDEPDLNLRISLVDRNGVASFAVNSKDYAQLPRPYSAYNMQLMGVRIPVEHFTLNNNAIDLTSISAVVITAEKQTNGEIGFMALDKSIRFEK